MEPGSKTRDFLWLGAGSALMLVIVLTALRFQDAGDPRRRMALGAEKSGLVDRLRYCIVAASEAEKSAVMAVTDQGSQASAEQSRAATAEAERARVALGERLASGADPQERKSFVDFSAAFTEFQRLDRELLELVARSSNLKAFALAFGPAAREADATDAALSRFLAAHPTAPPQMVLLAAGAQVAVRRIEARLAPHIAEASDRKMDDIEALMAGDDELVRRHFERLADQPAVRADPDLAAARSSYARFGEVRARIIALSRENTNVRALALSLDLKRKSMSACLNALDAIQRAIDEGTKTAPAVNPR